MTRFILYPRPINMLAFSVQAKDYDVCSNGSVSNEGQSHVAAGMQRLKDLGV